MSYIRSKRIDTPGPGDETKVGDVIAQDYGTPDLDMNLDDEMLDFVLGLLAQVNGLNEGEALVVWKEIF